MGLLVLFAYLMMGTQRVHVAPYDILWPESSLSLSLHEEVHQYVYIYIYICVCMGSLCTAEARKPGCSLSVSLY